MHILFIVLCIWSLVKNGDQPIRYIDLDDSNAIYYLKQPPKKYPKRRRKFLFFYNCIENFEGSGLTS